MFLVLHLTLQKQHLETDCRACYRKFPGHGKKKAKEESFPLRELLYLIFWFGVVLNSYIANLHVHTYIHVYTFNIKTNEQEYIYFLPFMFSVQSCGTVKLILTEPELHTIHGCVSNKIYPKCSLDFTCLNKYR